MRIISAALVKRNGSRSMRLMPAAATLTLLSLNAAFSDTTEFSQENAYAILKTLVVDIGPRPMGSPAEGRAMQFAVEKFREYGCDTSYVLPISVAAGVNTQTGVAVGVKKGRTNRIIIIGGHIDSAGPEIPGANDDASGTACVIELARVICSRETESTVYFCCWGGEEQGLVGSNYFVDNFELLDSVALMLQLDMADGSSFLTADPDGSNTSAPSWLVKSAFSIHYDELRRSDLVYQTEISTLNLATRGVFGSDHVPFIDKGIPAIDFTSDPTYPIHSPQDNWENFAPSGLKRSGDLVLKLFEKYDDGVPSRTTEEYQLFQIGSHVFFISYPLVWAFIGIACGSGIAAFVLARKRRPIRDPANRIKWSRFKLIVAALVLQICMWNSETLIGLLRGYRFPWVNNEGGFLVFAALSGLIGLWFVLQGTRRYRLSKDPAVFAGPALIAFFILTLAASYVTPEFGMYLAAILLCISLAIIIRKPTIQLVFFVAAMAVMYNLVFFDGIGLLQRGFTQNQSYAFWQKALSRTGYIVIFTVLSLPFLYAFAAMYRNSGIDLLWMKRLRTKSGLVLASIAVILMTGYLSVQPVYGSKWFSNVRILHKYRIGSDTSSLTIRGSEYFHGLAGTINGRDTTFTGRENFALMEEAKNFTLPWMNATQTVDAATRVSDSTWGVDRSVEIRSSFRPYQVEVTYESDQPFDVHSHMAHGGRTRAERLPETEKRKVFRWYSFPDTVLTLPVTFTLSDTQRVREYIEVMFDSVVFPIRLQREFTNIEYRTIVTTADTFSIAKR